MPNDYYKNDESHDDLKYVNRVGSKGDFCGYRNNSRSDETLEYKIGKFFRSTSTKYDENGRAITTKSSKSGLIHNQLMKSPNRQSQKNIVLLLICLVVGGFIGGLL